MRILMQRIMLMTIPPSKKRDPPSMGDTIPHAIPLPPYAGKQETRHPESIQVAGFNCRTFLGIEYLRTRQLTHQEPPNRGLDPQNGENRVNDPCRQQCQHHDG